MVMKLLEHSMKKDYERLINKNLGLKKESRIKVINYMSNGKIMIVYLIAGFNSIDCISIVQKWANIFQNHMNHLVTILTLKLTWLINATKTDIRNISHIDTSSFALKLNLASLKTEVDKSDIDKLVPVPVDLSKLRDVVKNDVVKKNCIW